MNRPRGMFLLRDVLSVCIRIVQEALWCAGWGVLGVTTTYPRAAWTWASFGAGDAFIHLSFGAPGSWLHAAGGSFWSYHSSVLCRVLVPPGVGKDIFPFIWSTASPGTWDILPVPGIGTLLKLNFSLGDWSDSRWLSSDPFNSWSWLHFWKWFLKLLGKTCVMLSCLF